MCEHPMNMNCLKIQFVHYLNTHRHLANQEITKLQQPVQPAEQRLEQTNLGRQDLRLVHVCVIFAWGGLVNRMTSHAGTTLAEEHGLNLLLPS